VAAKALVQNRALGQAGSIAACIAEAGEFTRDTKYIETRITADGSDGYPVQPTARSSSDGYSDWKACCPLGFAGQPMTSAAGLSISIPAASTRC
jgi:hypothetical protein